MSQLENPKLRKEVLIAELAGPLKEFKEKEKIDTILMIEILEECKQMEIRQKLIENLKGS